MGDVVIEHQAGAHGILEIQDVQAGGGLIQSVAIAARIKAKQAADQQADGGFVRDDNDILTAVLEDDLADDRQGTGNDLYAALTLLRGKSKGVFFPGSIFIRVQLLYLGTQQAFPAPMADLTQAIFVDQRQVVRLGQNIGGVNGAHHRTAVDSPHFIVCQTVSQTGHLVNAKIG